MTEMPADAENETRRLRRSAIAIGLFIGLLWLIKLADVVFALDLIQYGVQPRAISGLWGILFGPLIHGSWVHIFSNTLPLFILGTALLYGYPNAARYAIPLIFLVSGACVWVFARSSYHVGASGLTHGMMFFVFVSGVLRRDKRAIALALLVFFLYGGMVWTIFPNDPHISYESHLFGAITGVMLAFFLRNHDPTPPQKKYDWEDEPDGADDPLIEELGREDGETQP